MCSRIKRGRTYRFLSEKICAFPLFLLLTLTQRSYARRRHSDWSRQSRRVRQHHGGRPVFSGRGAIYHLNARTGSRSKGQSARAAAAYIQREAEYSRDQADELVYAESAHMPSWADAEPTAYWDAADLYERANGRLFKRVEVALPVALSVDEQRELAVGFAHSLTDAEQLPYTLAIHAGEGTNPHCHLLISERTNDGLERSPEQWFRRHNAAEPERGGARKTEALKPKAWLEETRAAWAEQTNQALERAGHAIRIDHRSLEEQGIERLPSLHLGPTVAAMEARGIETERGAEARRRESVNAQLAALTAQQEEPEYERARAEPEPGRAGAEREGGDVGERARGLAAGGGGERGPGLGNGGRAGRGAEPERDGELAGRDADRGDTPDRADRAAGPAARGARAADRAAGAGVSAVVGELDPRGVAGADSPPGRGPTPGRGGTLLYQTFGPPAQELRTYRGMWEAMTGAEKERINKRIRGRRPTSSGRGGPGARGRAGAGAGA